MWAKENRPIYNRDHLRYPSDLTDAEWSLIEPLIPPAKSGGGKRRTNMRKLINGLPLTATKNDPPSSIKIDPADLNLGWCFFSLIS